MSDYQQLVEALELIQDLLDWQQMTDSQQIRASEALPLTRQLIEENERLKAGALEDFDTKQALDAEIDQLSEENERLKESLAAQREDGQLLKNQNTDLQARLSAAEAERDQLREALEYIKRVTPRRRPAGNIARQALEGSET